MAAEKKKIYPALRVSQLDAEEIDQSIEEILLTQFRNVLESLPDIFSKWLSRLEPEVEAGLRSVLWWYSLRPHAASIGQEMLDLSYHGGSNRFRKWTKCAHYSLTVLVPWFSQRLPCLLSVLPLSSSLSEGIQRICDKMELLWKIVSLVQFLAFLRFGGYRSVPECILRIRAVHSEEPTLGEMDFSVMNRELLWHGFADLLIFLIPLINIRKLRRILKTKHSTADEHRSKSTVIARGSAVIDCTYCEQFAILPRYAACGHVFCNYCLQGNLLADKKFACPDCGAKVIEG